MKLKHNKKLNEEQSNKILQSNDALNDLKEFITSDEFEAFFEKAFDRFKSKFSLQSSMPHLHQSNSISILAIYEFKSIFINEVLNHEIDSQSYDSEEIFLTD